VTRLELVEALRPLWHDDRSIEHGIDQDFKCIYCGCDLLRSIDDMDRWNIDHIDPTLLGPEREALGNLAVACKLCNFVKRRYRPSGNTRDERIADAKARISEGREQKTKALADSVRLITAYHVGLAPGAN
jgi:HNH endonuclease